MASRGLRDLGDGVETIVEKEELGRVRRSAMRAGLATLGTAVFATVLFLIPG
jgi:hypothetical protein